MKNKFCLVGILTLIFCAHAFGQMSLPRESNFSSVAQTVGDTKISIAYHRPNTKGRKVWGELVPYGKVWRTGANDNTIFEIDRDVTVNGQTLAAGKYGLHTIPGENEWTLIFNRVNNAWGSFTYDEKQDALRVKTVPQKSPMMRETLMFEVESISDNSAQVVLSWENLRVPFTVNVGDFSARTLAQIRAAVGSRKPDDARPLNQGAGYIINNKLKANYGEALGWLDESIKTRETFGNLSSKARLLAEMGRTKEAVATGEKAVRVGKSATPPANTAEFEKTLAEWKAKR